MIKLILLLIIMTINMGEAITVNIGSESSSQSWTGDGLETVEMQTTITEGTIETLGNVKYSTGHFSYSKEGKKLDTWAKNAAMDIEIDNKITVTANEQDITPEPYHIKSITMADQSYASATTYPSNFNLNPTGNGLRMVIHPDIYNSGGLQFYWNPTTQISTVYYPEQLVQIEMDKWNNMLTTNEQMNPNWNIKTFTTLFKPVIREYYVTGTPVTGDGKNEMLFKTLNSEIVGLTNTRYYTDSSLNYAVESDVYFNTNYFSSTSTPRSFPEIAAHELGHTIGLGDVDNINEIMNYYSNPKSQLTPTGTYGPGTLQGLQLNYPTPNLGVGTFID